MGNSAGKVILSNGAVLTYNRPLTVAELMLDNPQEVVVEFNINVKKPSPLPADHTLHPEKLYLMLPLRKGKPAPLSSEQTRQILTKPHLLSYTGFLPLLARIGVRQEKKMVDDDHFTDIPQGRPEFLSRQISISGKGWKPSLDTIKEKTMRAKVRHWVF